MTENKNYVRIFNKGGVEIKKTKEISIKVPGFLVVLIIGIAAIASLLLAIMFIDKFLEIYHISPLYIVIALLFILGLWLAKIGALPKIFYKQGMVTVKIP